MKKKMIWSVLALSFMAFGMMSFEAAEPTALEIIEKMDDRLRGNSSETTMTMKIVRPKWTRTMTMKSWSKGDKYSLILVTGPARDKGTAFLKRDKEMWQWQPTISRVIKFPPSMMSGSWMGSDLTNEDLSNQSSIVTNYTHKKLAKQNVEGRLCYQIQLTPKPDAPVVWGKVLMWVDVKDFMQMKTEFYDEDNYLVNTMLSKNVKTMGGRLLPTKMEIIPVDEPGNKTILEYTAMKFEVKLADSFFSVQNMKKIR